MSAGDVVCKGWLIKSPPEKKLKRFVSRSTHRTLVYVLCQEDECQAVVLSLVFMRVCVCMCVYVCMLRCRMKIKRYTDLYVCLVSVSFISPTSSLVQVTLLLRVGVVIAVMCFSNNTPLTADVLQTHSDVSPCSEYM